MKLHTSIPPRRDGTVNVLGLDGASYKFERDGEGELACDVAHEPTVAFLLDGGMFYPAEPEDFAQALAIASAGADDDADLGSHDSPPVEAHTPPALRKPAPARAKKSAGAPTDPAA